MNIRKIIIKQRIEQCLNNWTWLTWVIFVLLILTGRTGPCDQVDKRRCIHQQHPHMTHRSHSDGPGTHLPPPGSFHHYSRQHTDTRSLPANLCRSHRHKAVGRTHLCYPGTDPPSIPGHIHNWRDWRGPCTCHCSGKALKDTNARRSIPVEASPPRWSRWTLTFAALPPLGLQQMVDTHHQSVPRPNTRCSFQPTTRRSGWKSPCCQTLPGCRQLQRHPRWSAIEMLLWANRMWKVPPGATRCPKRALCWRKLEFPNCSHRGASLSGRNSEGPCRRTLNRLKHATAFRSPHGFAARLRCLSRRYAGIRWHWTSKRCSETWRWLNLVRGGM